MGEEGPKIGLAGEFVLVPPSCRPVRACGKVVLKSLDGLLGGSSELWFFMTQHRKDSSEAKSQIKSDLLKQDTEEAYNFFQRVPCPGILSGLQSHKERKGGNRRRSPPLFLSEMSHFLTSSPSTSCRVFLSPHDQAELPWHHGKFTSQYNMRVFHFEGSSVHKLLFFYVRRQHVLGLINSPTHWAGCGVSCCGHLWGHVLQPWFCC